MSAEKHPERICYGCAWFCMQTADSGWSEFTPGTSWSMQCRGGKWSFDAYKDGVDKFKVCLETAQTCDKWFLRD